MSLQDCLTHLDDAIAAAATLGLDASAAASVRETARTRLGFPSDAYVLALAGGTGVCLLYTSPSPRDRQKSRMPSSA